MSCNVCVCLTCFNEPDCPCAFQIAGACDTHIITRNKAVDMRGNGRESRRWVFWSRCSRGPLQDHTFRTASGLSQKPGMPPWIMNFLTHKDTITRPRSINSSPTFHPICRVFSALELSSSRRRPAFSRIQKKIGIFVFSTWSDSTSRGRPNQQP